MAAVTKEYVQVWGLQIPVENIDEWDALNERTHEFIVAGKEVPQNIRVRMYELEGLSPQDAALLASCPEGGELNDCREIE